MTQNFKFTSYKSVLFIIVYLAVLLFMPVSSFAGSAKSLFIYWRGETLCCKGFKEGLKELGIPLEITEFDADRDKSKLDDFLSQLDESRYDFIYTFGTTVSIQTAEKVKKTPIIFGIVTNPVKAGLIKSWESSGNNVTGVSHAVSYTDQVEFILRLGDMKKVGMIFNSREKNSNIAKAELTKLFKAKGIEFITAPTIKKEEIEGSISKLEKEGAKLIYLPSDSFINTHINKIVPFLNSKGLPSYGALKKLIEKGAMIGVVSSYQAVGRELANKAAQILSGKKPSHIPSNILPFDKQTILVNGTTVSAVNAELPYELLSDAKIIE